MKALSKEQINSIRLLLKQKGLHDHRLSDEILDHICSSVEEKLNEIPFERAVGLVFKEFSNEELQSIQSNTRKIYRGIKLRKRFRVISSVAAVLILMMVVGADAQNKPQGMPCEHFIRMSSGFGMRMHPTKKVRRFHRGVDFSMPVGTPIIATAGGVVHVAEESDRGYGNRIKIHHSDSYMTVYAQLSELKVKEGEKVRKGQIIALSGNSGASTAPHLHYEVLKDGNPVNPALFIHKK